MDHIVEGDFPQKQVEMEYFDIKEGSCRSHPEEYCHSSSCVFLCASLQRMHASVVLTCLYEFISTRIDLEGMDWELHHEGNFPFCTVLPHMPDRITSILTLVTLV